MKNARRRILNWIKGKDIYWIDSKNPIEAHCNNFFITEVKGFYDLNIKIYDPESSEQKLTPNQLKDFMDKFAEFYGVFSDYGNTDVEVVTYEDNSRVFTLGFKK